MFCQSPGFFSYIFTVSHSTIVIFSYQSYSWLRIPVYFSEGEYTFILFLLIGIQKRLKLFSVVLKPSLVEAA